MSNLQGRTALVTGAGRGIGRSIAKALAAQGARVVVTARTTGELSEVVQEIEAGSGQALAVSADLSLRSAPNDIVTQVEADWGPIDILVNNAGVGSSAGPKPVVDFDDELWDLTIAVNLTAPYLLCKLVAPKMAQAEWGRIITVASINGKIGVLHGAAYAASKHGVLGLTRTLAIELAGSGVTVNAICPGPVRTRMNNIRIAYDAERRGVNVDQHEATITPIGRRLEPDEIAPLALYLASPQAEAVTGQAYNIDGGVVMTG